MSVHLISLSKKQIDKSFGTKYFIIEYTTLYAQSSLDENNHL